MRVQDLNASLRVVYKKESRYFIRKNINLYLQNVQKVVQKEYEEQKENVHSSTNVTAHLQSILDLITAWVL